MLQWMRSGNRSSTATDQPSKHYVALTRCEICRFDLEDGDPAIVGTNVGDISKKFDFDKNESWPDVQYKNAPICLRLPPYHPTTLVPCYHIACFHVAQAALSPELFVALAYQFQPTRLDSRRREVYLQHQAAGQLGQAFAKPHLPTELWLKIAALLVSVSAAAGVAQIKLKDAPSPSKPASSLSMLDLSRDVYASYVQFEGVRYIKALRNRRRAQAAAREYLILDAAKARTIHKVYVAFDHLGVRQVQFACPNRVLPGSGSVPGLWWKHLSREEGISRLWIKTDGLKLRDISDSDPSPGPNPRKHISWPIRDPGSPILLVDTDWSSPFLQHAKSLPRAPHLRMIQLEYNHPGITGYSAALDHDRLCMLQAHWGGKQDPDYDWIRDTARFHWVHMPINPGEYVTEVWVSPPHSVGYHIDFGLAFVTNRGRHTSFSSWRSKPMSPQRSYVCVQKPDRHGASLYFGAFEWEQRRIPAPGKSGCHAHFAFDKREPVEPREWPRSFVPASPRIARDPNSSNQFFSSCRLDDLVEVVPCRSRQVGAWAGSVMGLLLRYANGDRACVGSFRFDWAGGTCEVGRTGRLYIGYGGKPKSVRDISNEPPPVNTGLYWREVPLSGKLEWWSLLGEGKVYHVPDAA